MSERLCDCCGKSKEIAGGKVCDNGHFICKDCIYADIGFMGFGPVKEYCPICEKKLH